MTSWSVQVDRHSIRRSPFVSDPACILREGMSSNVSTRHSYSSQSFLTPGNKSVRILTGSGLPSEKPAIVPAGDPDRNERGEQFPVFVVVAVSAIVRHKPGGVRFAF